MTTPSSHAAPFPAASIVGYPRIGADRELKRALEAFWKNPTEDLVSVADSLRSGRTAHLQGLGLNQDSAIPEDFSYYDQVFDLIVSLGAIPERFAPEREIIASHPIESVESLEAQFKIARGEGDRAALQMTKWFDSNYHYLVPEIGPDTPIEFLGSYRGKLTSARPVLVGPVTFLLLSRATEGSPEDFHPLDRLDDVLAAYRQLLSTLNADWIQFDEPGLVSERLGVDRGRVLAALKQTYETLGTDKTAVALTYGHAFDAVNVLAETPVGAVLIDVVRGTVPTNLSTLNAKLAGRSLGVGIVSGRNIWRNDLDASLATLRKLQKGLPDVTVTVTTSTSLQHVPHDVTRETQLDADLRSWLAFADQKVSEVVTLAKGLAHGDDAIAAELEEWRAAKLSRDNHPGTNNPEVRQATASVTEADRHRSVSYPERYAIQHEELALPDLPTTTIGSFPQTQEIRAARAANRAGKLSDADYVEAMKKEIEHVIRVQEEIGLDVLVHGEPERNDMVQYFAEHLDGFATTLHGWVQSYGSRCTRPSLLWGDVSRPAPITVEWSGYAKSLTSREVKGMLTGPVTIMAWSFVREDIPWAEVADQLGLALREEIADLEEAGIHVIQVDEPAIRELLPLRKEDEDAYYAWSVGSFRLATSGARPETSIHTHLCYSDFNTVVDAVDKLGADVTSIEASRSKMAILPALADHGYERGLGPGVWDIHSPRVPSQEEIKSLIDAAIAALGRDKVWVNPDCGLKTRGWEETKASLVNLVAAAREARSEAPES